jgi:cell division protein FtsL
VSLPPEVPQPVNRPDTQQETTDQLHKVEREFSGFERATLRWAKVAVFMSAIAALFVCLQWYEMHSGAADTHDLAVAAGKQADAAKAQSEQAKAQTEKMGESLTKTDALITKATEQAAATNKLAKQAKRQSDIAAQTFEAEERPWIGMDHINPPAKIAAGTTPSSSLIYKNWGRGVAIHVESTYQMRALCGPFPTRPVYEFNGVPSQSLQMPGQTIETGKTVFNSALTSNDLLVMKQPNCGLYAYARITYRERGGREHWRHLCGMWDPTTDNTFQECGFYNDGDEDYPDGKEP